MFVKMRAAQVSVPRQRCSSIGRTDQPFLVRQPVADRLSTHPGRQRPGGSRLSTHSEPKCGLAYRLSTHLCLPRGDFSPDFCVGIAEIRVFVLPAVARASEGGAGATGGYLTDPGRARGWQAPACRGDHRFGESCTAFWRVPARASPTVKSAPLRLRFRRFDGALQRMLVVGWRGEPDGFAGGGALISRQLRHGLGYQLPYAGHWRAPILTISLNYIMPRDRRVVRDHFLI